MIEIEKEVISAFRKACISLEDCKVFIDCKVGPKMHRLEDGREVHVFVTVTTELDED